MMRNLLYTSSLILLLQFVACDKAPLWKQPTEVAISMNILSQDVGGPGDLEFTQGHIIISSITIDGKLKNADNFHFERNFSSGLQVDFNSATLLEDLKFDLPQGDYSELMVRFETLPVNNNIFVEGVFDYNNPNKPDAFVNFQVDSTYLFEVLVSNPLGNVDISIEEGANNDIAVILNPPYWFKNTTSTMMNNANTTVVNNQSYIVINSTKNANIYQSASSRIGGDAKSSIN